MAAIIVFSGGERVEVPSSDAAGVMTALIHQGVRDTETATGVQVPAGFADFDTDDGIVYVRPDQVAYVRDEPEMPEVEQTQGSIHMPEGRIVRGPLGR